MVGKFLFKSMMMLYNYNKAIELNPDLPILTVTSKFIFRKR